MPPRPKEAGKPKKPAETSPPQEASSSTFSPVA